MLLSYSKVGARQKFQFSEDLEQTLSDVNQGASRKQLLYCLRPHTYGMMFVALYQASDGHG